MWPHLTFLSSHSNRLRNKPEMKTFQFSVVRNSETAQNLPLLESGLLLGVTLEPTYTQSPQASGGERVLHSPGPEQELKTLCNE